MINKSIIHRDAHVGNIIYDEMNRLVTFIDDETAFESLFGGVDPMRDIGCFMTSMWANVLSKSSQENETELHGVYQELNSFREVFVQEYIEEMKSLHDTSKPFNLTIEQALNQVKLHMWGYGGYKIEGSDVEFPTLGGLTDKTVKYLIENELDAAWRQLHNLTEISEQ